MSEVAKFFVEVQENIDGDVALTEVVAVVER